jgi:hypothetical protein
MTTNQVFGRAEPECRLCEDWGTVVRFDDRGMPQGLDPCTCPKGLEAAAVTSAGEGTSAGSVVPALRSIVEDRESGRVGRVMAYGLHYGGPPTSVYLRPPDGGLEWLCPVDRVSELTGWISGSCESPREGGAL